MNNGTAKSVIIIMGVFIVFILQPNCIGFSMRLMPIIANVKLSTESVTDFHAGF